MAGKNQNIFRQVYNAHEDVRLLAAVHKVTCVLFRRGVLAAAFNSGNELLTVHYAGYGLDKEVWDLDFFEPLFSHEPLLSDPSKITKVFYLPTSTMVVPDTLYDRQKAENWLKIVHFVEENNEEFKHYFAQEEKNYIVSAVPMNIMALIKINCPTIAVLPVSAYMSRNNYTRGVRIHCHITPEQCMSSVYHYGSLLWHRVFAYTNAEDIAFEIRKVCEEHKLNADKVMVNCTTMTAGQFEVAKGLNTFFAGLTTASGHDLKNPWSPVLSLIKELNECA